MKKVYIIGLLIMSVFAIACDDVDPYGDYTFTPATGDPQYDDTTIYDSNLSARKIILEEFTGHDCKECPAGTIIAKGIKEDNPDRVILVAVHNAGSFSIPIPDKGLTSDFRTEAGERMEIRYNPAAFPASMISRIKGTNGLYFSFPHRWENTVDGLIADADFSENIFDVYLENIYNTEANSIRIRPTVTTLKSVSGDIRIGAYISESKIIAPQNDDNVIIPDYEHNHVLRVGFPNHGEGKAIFTDPQQGDTYSTVSVSDELVTFIDTQNWKLENLELIVFIYEGTTGEILWVDEMHVAHI